FGTNGSANTPVGAAGVSDTANAIEIQTINSEERIVVVGSTGNDFAVVRYKPDGTLDSTFDTDGIVITSIRSSVDTANGVAIQRSNNKIVVAGMSRSDLGGGSFNDDFALARYNTDGTLDVTFDTDGKVTTNISAVDAARDVVIQEIDGLSKIVAGGISMRPWPYHDFTLVRYNDNGAVDTTFGTNGRALTAIGAYEDQIHALALQPDNKIVAAGFARTGMTNINPDFALARYNADGSLDTSFGSCGKIITAIAAANGSDFAYGVAVQPDGKVIAAGHTQQGVSNDDVAVLRYMPRGSSASPTSIDFDGDGRSDVAVYRAGSGNWYINSTCASPKSVSFGTAGDRIVPADYDGDGQTDFAVFRSGVWYISRSSNNTIFAQQFGLADDIPVTGDYDGDNKADIAVFRPSNGYWYVSNSSNGALQAVELGTEGDLPVPADYNGDGTTEFAVFRPSNATWYTSPDPANNYGAQQFGQEGDVPVQGDYDGDGKADLAVFRPSTGTWYLQQSTAGLRAAQFGLSTDQPVAGDYDGDGKNDLAVFRSGAWYISNSAGGTRTVQWGASDDLPVAAR
ncbi:MAG: VCBS repeat-containing protein, partial [Pyrinomonadaceae bacterium]|nr:VCBS repeat-containing protein [Pyrinomonadaceae bacterium]